MNTNGLSNSFQIFIQEAPKHSEAWMEVVQKLDTASSLEKKTEEIAYVSVLAALGLESGISFHVKQARANGATRNEIKSAILLGLAAAGNIVIKALPVALQAYDEV